MATKAVVACALAGTAAAFSGLAPVGLKPSGGKLTDQRLQLRSARPEKKVSPLCQNLARPPPIPHNMVPQQTT